MNLREQILEESLKLFTLKGFLCTSMNDILSACQTSKGGFYNHFPSKEALFDEVVAKARRNWRAKNLVGLEDEPSPVGKVRTMLVNYRDRYLKDTANLPGGCPFVMLAVELADQRPDYARELNRGFRAAQHDPAPSGRSTGEGRVAHRGGHGRGRGDAVCRYAGRIGDVRCGQIFRKTGQHNRQLDRLPGRVVCLNAFKRKSPH